MNTSPSSTHRTHRGYSAIDSGNPDVGQAVTIANYIITHCMNPENQVDKQKLFSIMNMVISHIHDETGVLASIAPATAANNEPNLNPRDPDQWGWASWERSLFQNTDSTIGMGLGHKEREKLCSILGANISEKNQIISLLQQDSFKNSLSEHRDMEDYLVSNIIQSSQRSGLLIFEKLFNYYETSESFKPTGMIRAAIELGYLPEDHIKKIHEMA